MCREASGVGTIVGIVVGGKATGDRAGEGVATAVDVTHPSKNRANTTLIICCRNFGVFILAPFPTTICSCPIKYSDLV
jgi:hypothetical protein